MDLDRALEAALAAAAAAGEILRRDFHRPGGARGSGDKAEADLDAEERIRALLTAAFPTWSYRGEETGTAHGDAEAPVWLVDPNDGTRDYLAGRRGSAVSIALAQAGRPVLGVVFAFAYPDDGGDLFAWAEGCGPLRRNGHPVAATLPRALAGHAVVLVSSKGDRDVEGNLRAVAPARFRAVPSIAHRLALVASGEAAGAAALLSPGDWDYAAGHALLRASGGDLVDEHGRPVRYAADGSSRSTRCFGGSPEVAAHLAASPAWEGVRTGPWREAVPARLSPGRAVADPARLARAQGCLLGQVAGDSLGSRVEFEAAEAIARAHRDGPRWLEDGGVWNTLGGQPTDDSEMALALARAVLAAEAYRADTALAAYREWFRSEPFDIGATTRAALSGRALSDSQANGSLMRASPLGVLAHEWSPAEAARLARLDSALTHPHPVCGDSVAAFVIAIAHAVHRGDGPRAAYQAARAWAEAEAEPAVARALVAAAAEAAPCDGESQGWVLIALQNAFHALLHADSVEEGVIGIVRRGGDTDTNAAIAGALLGAVHGRGGIPGQWRSMILSCRAHPSRAARPRPAAYWPVDVEEIAERLLLVGR